MIEDLARAIRSGGEVMISIESVRPTLEWSLAMYQSAKTGAAVELPVLDEEAVW